VKGIIFLYTYASDCTFGPVGTDLGPERFGSFSGSRNARKTLNRAVKTKTIMHCDITTFTHRLASKPRPICSNRCRRVPLRHLQKCAANHTTRFPKPRILDFPECLHINHPPPLTLLPHSTISNNHVRNAHTRPQSSRPPITTRQTPAHPRMCAMSATQSPMRSQVPLCELH
jgi:hypothetical protein